MVEVRRRQGQALRDKFGMSATRYYQTLNALIDQPAALAQDPLLVKRLRRLRASRQRSRSAKRLGIDLSIDLAMIICPCG